MTLNKKLALNSIIQILGKFVMIGVGFVSIRILTTFLGVDGFGAYVTITNYLIIASVLAEFGFNTLLSTEIAGKDEKEVSHIVNNLFTFRLVMAVSVIGILASTTVWLIPTYTTEVKTLVALGAIGTIGASLSHVLIGIFQTKLRTDKITIGDFLARITLMLGVLALAFLGQVNLFWVMVWYSASGIVQATFMIISTYKYYPLKLNIDWQYWKQIFKKALPLFVIITFNLIYYRIDTVMLSVMKDQTAVGLYGASYKILEILIAIPGMFMGILLPLFAKYYLQERTRFQHIFQQAYNILLTIAIPLAMAGILLSNKILNLIAGQDFMPATSTLQVLFIGIGFIFLGNLMGHILIGASLQNKSMYIAVIGAVFNVALNLYLIPRYSYLGAAIATAITEGLVLLSYIYLVKKHIQYFPKFQFIHLISVLATIIMGVSIYFTQNLNIFIQTIIAMLVFGVVFLPLGLKRLKHYYAINIQE
jgi:O-antigen/teichoic acid export membrane protein